MTPKTGITLMKHHQSGGPLVHPDSYGAWAYVQRKPFDLPNMWLGIQSSAKIKEGWNWASGPLPTALPS